MKTIRKSRLSLAIAASLGGALLAHDAAAVNLATDGIGEVAIMPYYTTRGGWLSLINLTNVRPYPVVVKVRIHEYQNSRDALDFNVALSGYDVFVAAIREKDDGTGPVLVSNDTDTCVIPQIPVAGYDLSELAFEGSDNRGVNDDGGGTTADRLREGYVEFIVMGFTGADHTATQQLPEVPFAVPATVIGNLIEDHECGMVSDAFAGNNILETARQFGEPINALNFNFRLLNPSRGVEAGGNATTWANFFNEGGAGPNLGLGSPLASADFRILPQDNFDPANNGFGDPNFPANDVDACDITRGQERTREPAGINPVEWDPAGSTDANGNTSCRNLITAQTTYDFLEPSLNDAFPASSGFPGGGACGYEDTRNQGGCIDAPALGEGLRVVPTLAGDGVSTVLPQGPRGVDAVSGTIQRATVINEWSSEVSLGTEADWVVTFPTKTFYVDYGLTSPLAPQGGHQFGMIRDERDEAFYGDPANLEADGDGILTPPYPPFSETFASWTAGVLDANAGESCNQVSFSYFDRAENGSIVQGGVIPSPAPVEATAQMCFEANVVTFNGGSVLDSPDAVNVETDQTDPAEAGWMKLRLDEDNSADATSVNPNGFPAGAEIRGGLMGASGLPVTGYMVKQRTFGDVTRNYASSMAHTYERYAPDNLPAPWPNIGPIPDLP